MGLSVIVPTRNRAASLAATLAQLGRQRPNDAMEVLVIDNGSNDDTRGVVEAAIRQSPIRMRYFYEPVPGLLSGRHRGVLESAGDLISFIDDDVLVGPDWLGGVLEGFRSCGAVLVGGPSSPKFESLPPDWLEWFYVDEDGGRACEWLSLLDLGTDRRHISAGYIWGLNFSIRRTALVEAGGFHPDNMPKALQFFQGDGETAVTDAVSDAGHKGLYMPEAAVRHMIPATRLTVEYFKDRAFYAGVGASYRMARAGGRARPATDLFRIRLGRTRRLLKSDRKARIEAELAQSFLDGRTYHRQALQRYGQSLLNWVVRPNYWDYQLPALPELQPTPRRRRR